MPFDNHSYNKHLQPYANELRKNMTKAEACLWKYVLRASQLRGYPFRRQRPVSYYIADFLCKELMLIIEVDGITHHYEVAFEKDEKRQRDLEYLGYTVLRFEDSDILNHIDHVRNYLKEWIDKNGKK